MFRNSLIVLRELTFNALPSYPSISNALFLTRSITLCVTTIGTEEYSLTQQYVFKLIKPGYMFQLYSHYQAYLQSLVELYMLNSYAMWDPSSEAKHFTDRIKNVFLVPSVNLFASILGFHTAYEFNIYSSTSDCR
jgi:hypothetical protein